MPGSELEGDSTRDPLGERVALVVSPSLVATAQRLRREVSVWFFVGGAVILLLIVGLLLEGPPEAPVFAGVLTLVCVAFGLLLLYADRLLLSVGRFDHEGHPRLIAEWGGIGGRIFSPDQYAVIRPGAQPPKGFSSSAVAVRSPILRRTLELSELPNFVRWRQITIVVGAGPESPSVRFWSRRRLDPAGILNGIVCEPTLDELRRFLSLALAGGADIHIAPPVLSRAAAGRLLACSVHDELIRKGYRRSFGDIGATRLPPQATWESMRQWLEFARA